MISLLNRRRDMLRRLCSGRSGKTPVQKRMFAHNSHALHRMLLRIAVLRWNLRNPAKICNPGLYHKKARFIHFTGKTAIIQPWVNVLRPFLYSGRFYMCAAGTWHLPEAFTQPVGSLTELTNAGPHSYDEV